MKFSTKKNGILVFCVLFFCLLPAAALEVSAVVRLNETVPRAILFGLGLFALWMAIWLPLFRGMAAMWARDKKPIADPVDRSRAELSDVLKIGALGSCAIILFILFPWVQGFAMPPCSVLMLKLFCLFCVGGGVSIVWAVLRLRTALRAQRRAQITRTGEPNTLRESKGKTASDDLNAAATG
ncbi:MAG: hypothetical protein IH987_17500 [Planctomycetes bacterium]|nr:hypothetical protein [Planctomycetota bacterium]